MFLEDNLVTPKANQQKLSENQQQQPEENLAQSPAKSSCQPQYILEIKGTFDLQAPGDQRANNKQKTVNGGR